jgi:hypothetical protein
MRNRGVSEVLGYVLVFSLVVVMVAIISVSGLTGYQDVQTFERQSNAGKAYDVMHNNIEDIYYGGAPSRATEIDLGETRLSLGGPVTINVTAGSGSDRVHTNVTTRPLVQRLGDGNELVYEGGAVFRTSPEGGLLRRDPPMTLRADSAHVIVSNVSQQGRRGVGGGLVRVRARSLDSTVRYENRSDSGDISLNVTVHSPRADLWAAHLEAQPTFDSCTVDGSRTSCETDDLDRLYVVQTDLGIYFDR